MSGEKVEENHDSRRHVYVLENILNWKVRGSNPSLKAGHSDCYWTRISSVPPKK